LTCFVLDNNVGVGDFVVKGLLLGVEGGPEEAEARDKPANPVTDADAPKCESALNTW
jgi:hypothetical protein